MGGFWSAISGNPKDPTDTSALEAITQKALDALKYALMVDHADEPPKGKGVRVEGDHGEIADAWWIPELAQLVLAFKVPSAALADEHNTVKQPKCLAGLRQLKLKEGTVTVAPSLCYILDEFLADKGYKAIEQLLGGSLPRSIVCTGLGVGGSLAAVTSVLMAVQYPSAEVRCVTVNAPIITYGNPAFAQLYRFLVGFSYHVNTAQLISLLPPDQNAFPLYGQWVATQDIAKLKPTKFDATQPDPGNWTAKDMSRLIGECGVMEMPAKTANLPPVDAESKKADQEKAQKLKNAQAHMAAQALSVKGWLLDLYAQDPMQGLSLKWSDKFTPVPFKSLDSIEKLLLAGKKVTAMAGLSMAAYQDMDKFTQWTGLRDAMFINRDKKGQKDGQAYVALRPDIKTLLVAFRGTKGFEDALIDLQTSTGSASFLDTVVKGAKVHSGFYSQLVDMWPTMQQAITNLQSFAPGAAKVDIQQIYVTGHSLGGACATIGAAMFAKMFPLADVNCITFAAPRAGNKEFDAAFLPLVSTSLRFVYNYDAVPTLPMWYLGFTHVDHSMWLRPATKQGVDGIDLEAKLDIENAPAHSPTQAVGIVGADKVVANHNIGQRYIGALVGYMQAQAQEERQPKENRSRL